MLDRISSRDAGRIGFAAAAVSLAAIFIAIALFDGFSYTDNFLSDLGRPAPSSYIFNSGMLAGGILGFIFSIKLINMDYYKSRLGMKFFVLSSVSLALVGMFPVYTDMPHTGSSFLFFMFSVCALIAIGYSERKEGLHGLVFLALGILSLTTLPLYAVPRPYGTNAVVELVTTLSVIIFVLITSARLIRIKF